MPLEERLADEARFFKTWIDNPLGTGAVSPSGRFLARTMARYVDLAVPGPVIELGPGTGPVTEALIERGVARDRLILVEFEPHFCKLLARRYEGVRIVQGDAYRLAETLSGVIDAPASAIVSSLPLRTRRERDRLALLRDAFALLHPEAAFVQFTYGIASPMPRRFGPGPIFHAEVSAPIWLNLPPARVWVYRFGAVAAQRGDGMAAEDFTLKLKAGRELLGEEWREQSDRLKLGLRLKAEKARAEFKAHAEKVKSGLNRTFRDPAGRLDGIETGHRARRSLGRR
ncbi:MAG TPA: ribose ABC transporter permease [Lichenihabitans sp.]|jgi:phosphatidylethanolamine/phosphatidyl-N-methylethanolamine N-methyltransferase|nr:ribose ABC transporter permease [Lichenihabitans sp.]